MPWLALILVASGGFLTPLITTAQTPLVVVMSHDSPVDDVQLDELRRLFEVRTSTLREMPRIVLYQHRASREQFYRQALNTTVSRATRAWIALVFSGDAVVPPVDFDSVGEVIRAVASRPGSLAFIPVSEVDVDLVKVLLIDGLSADDPTYPLR